jgi:hypothetical protein
LSYNVRGDCMGRRVYIKVLEGNGGKECILFSKAIALRVKYPMKTPRRLIIVLRTPKTRVMIVSEEAIIIVS